MGAVDTTIDLSEVAPKENVHSPPQLIMDGRSETAIRRHMDNLGLVSPEDNWKYVKNQTQALYDSLLLSNPGLLDYPNGDVLQAPINKGVLYPLKGVRGLGVMFLMDERPVQNGKIRLSVAATFWFAGSTVDIGDK